MEETEEVVNKSVPIVLVECERFSKKLELFLFSQS